MILDIAPTELLVLGAVALVVIPPKDLPRAMRLAGQWIGRARGMARQFRSGFDDLIRESEFQEMEKKWRAENERIMREFPPTPDQAALMAPAEADAPPLDAPTEMATMVAQPDIVPSAATDGGATPPNAQTVDAKPAAKPASAKSASRGSRSAAGAKRATAKPASSPSPSRPPAAPKPAAKAPAGRKPAAKPRAKKS